MKSATIDGREVAYDIEGKGRTVVLLHGFCEDSYVWEDFRQDLLEEQYRVVRIDLPGFGRSTAGPETISDYARAVLAVADQAGLDDMVLIGHSMGGYTALAVAEMAPDRLRGLGLFHSHPYADSSEKKAARLKAVSFIERLGHQVYVKQQIPTLFAPRYVSSHPFMVDKLIFRASRYPRQGIINALHAMRNRPDRSEVLRNLNCPVLFINGQLDRAVSEQDRQAQLALPAVSHIHVYDRVSHMGMFEATRPTQLALRQFAEFCYR